MKPKFKIFTILFMFAVWGGNLNCGCLPFQEQLATGQVYAKELQMSNADWYRFVWGNWQGKFVPYSITFFPNGTFQIINSNGVVHGTYIISVNKKVSTMATITLTSIYGQVGNLLVDRVSEERYFIQTIYLENELRISGDYYIRR